MPEQQPPFIPPTGERPAGSSLAGGVPAAPQPSADLKKTCDQLTACADTLIQTMETWMRYEPVRLANALQEEALAQSELANSIQNRFSDDARSGWVQEIVQQSSATLQNQILQIVKKQQTELLAEIDRRMVGYQNATALAMDEYENRIRVLVSSMIRAAMQNTENPAGSSLAGGSLAGGSPAGCNS